MKNVKRFLSLILVSVMVLAMSMPVFAKGETDGKITITNSGEGQTDLTYIAYQVVAGDVTKDGDVTKFSNVEWGSGINSTAFVTEVQKITGFDSVTNAEEFVEAISAYNDDADVMQQVAAAVAKCVTGTPVTSTQSGTSYELNVGEYGYYFVTDKDGLAVASGRESKYYLIVVDDADNANLKVKTEVPSQEKKVQENTNIGTVEERETWGEGFNDVADYNIGDPVPFEIISTIPNFKGVDEYYYQFVDTMDAGFTFDENSVTVTINDKNDIEVVKATLTGGTDYVLDTNPGDGSTFTVTIANLVGTIDEAYIGEKLVVRFNATLNENAVIGNDGNYNTSKLRYGNKPGENGGPRETPEDTVVVFTYKLPNKKTDESGQELAGAKFVLKNKDGKYYQRENGKTNWVNDEADATVLVSDSNGDFSVVGLDQGTYSLKEIEAPAGYNLLKSEIEVTIKATRDANGNPIYNQDNVHAPIVIDVAQAGQTVTTVEVENQSGVELPETGGIGTTIFYIIGALMALGAGVVLVTRRRMSK